MNILYIGNDFEVVRLRCSQHLAHTDRSYLPQQYRRTTTTLSLFISEIRLITYQYSLPHSATAIEGEIPAVFSLYQTAMKSSRILRFLASCFGTTCSEHDADIHWDMSRDSYEEETDDQSPAWPSCCSCDVSQIHDRADQSEALTCLSVEA